MINQPHGRFTRHTGAASAGKIYFPRLNNPAAIPKMSAMPSIPYVAGVIKNWRVSWAWVIGLGLFAGAGFSLEAAAPFLDTSDLFVAAPGDYYHIPGLVVTSKGTVLAYAAWRQKGAHDWGNIKVHLRRSTDGGKTWTPWFDLVFRPHK